MQYPFLALLEITTVLLTLLMGIIIFYFLTKKWKEVKFITVLKAFVLYELVSLLIYFVYSSLSFRGLLKIFSLLIFSIILFSVFYLIMKKIFLIDWKKTLISFLIIVVVALPLLDFIRVVFTQKIMNFSVFAKEYAQMEAEMEAYFEEYGFGGFLYSPIIPSPPEPLILKTIGIIEKATLSWPGDQLREVIIATQLR